MHTKKPVKTTKKVKLSVKISKKKAKKTKKPSSNIKSITHKKEEIKDETNNTDQKEILPYKEIEKEKNLVMWSGVTFFMLLILFFWVYNTKLVFRKIAEESPKYPDFELNKLSEDISKTIKEVEKNIKPQTTVNETEKIEELKTKIEELSNTNN